jgi:hypothetical protein
MTVATAALGAGAGVGAAATEALAACCIGISGRRGAPSALRPELVRGPKRYQGWDE